MRVLLKIYLFIFLIGLLFHNDLSAQGPQWIVYNYQNSDIPDISLRHVEIDTNNVKWVSCSKGLIKFDDVNWTLYDTTNSPLRDFIFDLKSDANNDLWLSPRGQGLCKFDGTNWIFLTTANSGLPWNYLTAIGIESDTIKWLTTANGKLVRFDNYNWTVYDTTNSGFKQAAALSIEITGNVKWMALFFYGLLKYDNNTWTYYNTSNSGIQDNNLWSISFENQNVLWIGSRFGGASRFDVLNNQWTVYNNVNSPLPNNDIGAIYYYPIDSSKFFGHFGYGLSKLKGTTWSIYTQPIPEEAAVNSFKKDKYNNLWIATTFGLYVYNPNGVVSIKNEVTTNKNFHLSQNYPNPFNPVTKIHYQIPKSSFVTMKVFDISGKEITTLVNENHAPGTYETTFEGCNFSSGIYFYMIQAGDFVETKKMLLVK